MNSLSGAAVLNRRKGASRVEPPPIVEDALQWATISSGKSKELAEIKTVCYDPETKNVFATHKSGAVLLWDWKAGRFETFLAADKDRNDLIHAVLGVGNSLWVSSKVNYNNFRG